jgi:hypothetical protein
MHETATAAMRRQNTRMAERVQCGVSLQFIAGAGEAKRYMANCGVPAAVIERVLGSTPLRRQHGTHSVSDRRQFEKS